MRLRKLVVPIVIVLTAGCGQSDGADGDAASAQSGDVPLTVAIDTAATRSLSPELPGDDPTFRAAIDAFDGDELERRVMEVSGLDTYDIGGGYFGQKFYVSVWRPVSDELALDVCNELVTYANELDFPATQILVREQTYADLELAKYLAEVDTSGACVLYAS